MLHRLQSSRDCPKLEGSGYSLSDCRRDAWPYDVCPASQLSYPGPQKSVLAAGENQRAFIARRGHSYGKAVHGYGSDSQRVNTFYYKVSTQAFPSVCTITVVP